MQTSQTTDTIVALATPAGTSALSVIRVSGPQTQLLLQSLLNAQKLPPPRHLHHTDYRDQSGTLLDDVLLSRFIGSSSYTGEDSFEISTHGNPYIVRQIISDLVARGCRPALPGEFTQRAFLNGKIDLSQAEAVMDLIHARSEHALHAANQQLRGSLGRYLDTLITPLIDIIAQVEAYIDFPDEDLPPENRQAITQSLSEVLRGTKRLLSTQQYGEFLRDGIKTVIIGLPNVGKSSILNRLLGYDRALVSPEPGTTRDFIEEPVSIGRHLLRLIDTAGLNPSPGKVEKMGMEKTLERAAEARLFLWVVDATVPLPRLDSTLQQFLTSQNTLLLLNKSDLLSQQSAAPPAADFPAISISAQTGSGFESLASAIEKFAESFIQENDDQSIAINIRHADALTRAHVSLLSAAEKIGSSTAPELLASDLRAALDAFGEIAGRIDNERILDQLFARFCIGK